jgi:hypothetical protein
MLSRERDDTGVVAIIVALSVSTFLLGFAALAVDLGAAYARQTDIQSTAEELAMAGAAGLPDIATAVARLDEARRHACERDRLPGICDLPDSRWEQDRDLSNGEVRFYDDRGQSGVFADLESPLGLDPDDFLVHTATKATGIRVMLPPSRVEFGLASAMGFDSVDLTRSATARIGTPLGRGILPFALTQADLNRGEFCAADNRVTGGIEAPQASGYPVFQTPDTVRLAADAGDQEVPISLMPFPPAFLRSVIWHSTNSTTALTATRPTRPGAPWSVTVPEGPDGTLAYVWATGRTALGIGFKSHATTVNFGDPATPDDGLCSSELSVNRGFINLARADGGGLTDNVRQGPQTKLYNSTSELGGQILDRVSGCVRQFFRPSTACLSPDLFSTWSSDVQAGLLTSGQNGTPGRMTGDCGGGTRALRGAEVDASYLIDHDSPFLSGRDPKDLRERILGHGVDAADAGWKGAISSRAMRCGRLAMMPVVDPVSPAGLVGAKKIVKFVYVWIDEANTGSRGLRFTSTGKLTSVRGYVLEPGLFPPEVAGSPLVGPYLGDDMPTQVVLVHDLGSPGT